MTKYTALQTEFTENLYEAQDTVVIALYEGEEPDGESEKIDEKTSGAVGKALHAGGFSGKYKEICVIGYPAGLNASHVILLGLGKRDELTRLKSAKLGGELYAKLASCKCKNAYVLFPEDEKKETALDYAAYGAELRAYKFADYKTKKIEKTNEKRVSKISFYSKAGAKRPNYEKLSAARKGTFFARDLVTSPPNILTPMNYAEQIRQTLTPEGVKVKILNRKNLERLGMGALLGVAQGSENEGCVVVMEWNGNPGSKETKAAFVGKGVTFDTGGISLKPSAGMEDMKYDMGGSASVCGAMLALAARKAAVNAVGIVGLVENMPDGKAQRPSDVVTSLSGQTIEVLNTDAEGRLVLADILTYVQDQFAPEIMIDLATLTGAMVIALGSEYAGIFSNSDKLSEKLTQAGLDTGEKVWRFPLHKNYDKCVDSKIADMQNISSERGAGSITAAQFLQRFVSEKTEWVHIDIAGVAWTKKGLDVCPAGASGFGVRLLDHLIAEHYEL